jgi:hypothetical protein
VELAWRRTGDSTGVTGAGAVTGAAAAGGGDPLRWVWSANLAVFLDASIKGFEFRGFDMEKLLKV